MTLQRIALATALLLGWAAAGVSAAELGIGDPAPKLQVKEFVKGDPVASFEKGKTYVVEFWATWCGPCRTSIPHVTELQKKYKDITFIGVSVWEKNPSKVKPFVEEMGDKMAYRVATDAPLAKGEGDDAAGKGQMAATWMDAAGQNGIPAAFIVNGDGLVAWIGHPMNMDKPLADIAAGTYDLKAAATKFKKDQAQQGKLQALGQKYAKAMQAGDTKAALDVLDQAIKDDPELEERLSLPKFQLLIKEDKAKAAEYGKQLAEGTFKDNAQGLNNIAWFVVDPAAKEKPDRKLIDVALAAAKRADELMKGKDGGIADTLAKAYFDAGDATKALETQERAVKLAQGTALARDKTLIDRLEQYRKAAEKK